MKGLLMRGIIKTKILCEKIKSLNLKKFAIGDYVSVVPPLMTGGEIRVLFSILPKKWLHKLLASHLKSKKWRPVWIEKLDPACLIILALWHLLSVSLPGWTLLCSLVQIADQDSQYFLDVVYKILFSSVWLRAKRPSFPPINSKMLSKLCTLNGEIIGC